MSQALDLGLVLGQDLLGLIDARKSRRDVSLGHLHHLLGQRDPPLVEHDGRLLRPILLDQLGREEGSKHIAFLHLIADVHDPLLDVGGRLGIDRRALVALDEAGLPDDPDDVPDRRVDHLDARRLRGAREAGLALVAAAWHHEGGKETEEEPAAVGGTIGNHGPKVAAHRGSPGKGAVHSSGRPGDLSEFAAHQCSPGKGVAFGGSSGVEPDSWPPAEEWLCPTPCE